MVTTAAARHDLYNALRNTLGSEHADTLMAHLPTIGSEEVAARVELTAMSNDIAELRRDMSALRTEVNSRLDRMFLAQIATFVALGTAIIVT